MKLAVIIATYCRSNGKTPGYLTRICRNLEAQTYQDFKVFIVGDCYSKPDEFNAICFKYKTNGHDITYINQDTHFRIGIKRPENRWRCGGAKARAKGVEMAIAEGYDYYLHLDDDDVWKPRHIESYVDALKQYPSVDFLASVSFYKNMYLSPGYIKDPIHLNNLIPYGGGASHSSWCVNLNTLGDFLMQKYKRFIQHVETIIENNSTNPNYREPKLPAFDAHIMQHLRRMYNAETITTLCLTEITVIIESDENHPHQGI